MQPLDAETRKRLTRLLGYSADVIGIRVTRPKSRAENETTLCGSTSRVRSRSCAACGSLLATSDARWPETKASILAAERHERECLTLKEMRRIGNRAADVIVALLTANPETEDSPTP